MARSANGRRQRSVAPPPTMTAAGDRSRYRCDCPMEHRLVANVGSSGARLWTGSAQSSEMEPTFKPFMANGLRRCQSGSEPSTHLMTRSMGDVGLKWVAKMIACRVECSGSSGFRLPLLRLLGLHGHFVPRVALEEIVPREPSRSKNQFAELQARSILRSILHEA